MESFYALLAYISSGAILTNNPNLLLFMSTIHAPTPEEKILFGKSNKISEPSRYLLLCGGKSRTSKLVKDFFESYRIDFESTRGYGYNVIFISRFSDEEKNAAKPSLNTLLQEALNKRKSRLSTLIGGLGRSALRKEKAAKKLGTWRRAASVVGFGASFVSISVLCSGNQGAFGGLFTAASWATALVGGIAAAASTLITNNGKTMVSRLHKVIVEGQKISRSIDRVKLVIPSLKKKKQFKLLKEIDASIDEFERSLIEVWEADNRTVLSRAQSVRVKILGIIRKKAHDSGTTHMDRSVLESDVEQPENVHESVIPFQRDQKSVLKNAA